MIGQLRPIYIYNLNLYLKTIEQRNNYLRQIETENKLIDARINEIQSKDIERKYDFDIQKKKLNEFNAQKVKRPFIEDDIYLKKLDHECRHLIKSIKETSKNTIFALKEEILNKINEWESSENDVHDDKIPLKERFFHLLGIDILISEDKKPYVLELNDNPAIKNFNEVDFPIKEETVKSEIQLIRSLFIEKNSEFDDPQWEKLEKASKLGIPIINEQQFLEMIGG